MRESCLHLLANSSGALSTGFGRIAEAARSRMSSPGPTMNSRAGSSRARHRDGSSTNDTETSGGLFVPYVADAERSTSPNPPAKASQSVDSVASLLQIGTRNSALDLLSGLSAVLGHEIRAAWNLGEDLVGNSLEGLMEDVLDAADVITHGEVA